jgi:hypothetical protein
MPIIASDFVWRAPRSISDTVPAENGGRMGSAVIATNTKNAIFPDVTQAQRTAGAVAHRKVFIHVSSVANIALLDARVWLGEITASDDYVHLIPGTHTDTEDEIAARPYGAGVLLLSAEAEDVSIDVVPEGLADLGALTPFVAGDLIRISDGTAGEYHVIDSVTDNTTHWTIAFDGSALANAFDAADTIVSAVIEQASVAASTDSVVTTSPSGGTFNGAAIVAANRGATRDTITITFTAATTFTAAGLIAGSLGAGSRAADFSPINPATSSPRFTIPSTAWGGTFALGNTVVFELYPASIPIWYQRRVPAGAGSLSDAAITVSVFGESAG